MILTCSVGDSLVDRYVDYGMLYPGGSAANVSVHCQRLGCNASYVGIIGGDMAGHHVRRSLEAEGVRTDLAILSDEPASYADVGHDEFGNRRFLAYEPPKGKIVLGQSAIEHLAKCNWVHTGHTSFIESEVERIASLARVVFDFSHRGLDFAAPLLPCITVAVFSRATASDKECLALIDAISRQGPSMVVVTRGERGAVIKRDEELVVQRPDTRDAELNVDTLGAGDAFIAALMTGLESGMSLGAGSRFAAEYAARVCKHFGAFGHARPIHEMYPDGSVASLQRSDSVIDD